MLLFIYIEYAVLPDVILPAAESPINEGIKKLLISSPSPLSSIQSKVESPFPRASFSKLRGIVSLEKYKKVDKF